MRKTLLATLAAGALLALPAAAQMDDVKITATKLADGIHMLTGKGGNIGVLTGPDGTFMIDDQFAPLTARIMVAVKSIGGDTPRFLINTHYHFDHTGGNENLGNAGVTIVSHDNVRKKLAEGTTIVAFNRVMPPAPKAAVPVITFTREMTFHLNGETVHAIHSPNAHTDGDTIIHFEKANMIHAGDLFFNGFYPFIDVEHGGSAAGMIKAADAVLAMAGPNTKIIPGHGPLADKVALRAYRDMLKGVHDAVKKLVDAGTPRAEAVAAQPTQAFDAEWGDGFLRPEVFAGFVYDSMTK